MAIINVKTFVGVARHGVSDGMKKEKLGINNNAQGALFRAITIMAAIMLTIIIQQLKTELAGLCGVKMARRAKISAIIYYRNGDRRAKKAASGKRRHGVISGC